VIVDRDYVHVVLKWHGQQPFVCNIACAVECCFD
jgi:hypothetical protein